MKKIFLMILSIMFVILSCKTATAPIDSKRTGKFVSEKTVSADSYLVVDVTSDGGFKLYYSTDETGKTPSGKENKVTESDIKGEDPNYTFQTGVMAGSLQFLSDKVVKITVTFNDGPTTLKDILCYQK
ncbi:hypothetical protein [uncultured Brachyspira sp.]|uniref:hypothetical protein n=1 Tax=uncultured Brachyspira sp. TaxID=221953 RepID=UPI0025F5C007|nr:hypothetical protein [uncultured Brachyspira sp.]